MTNFERSMQSSTNLNHKKNCVKSCAVNKCFACPAHKLSLVKALSKYIYVSLTVAWQLDEVESSDLQR